MNLKSYVLLIIVTEGSKREDLTSQDDKTNY